MKRIPWVGLLVVGFLVAVAGNVASAIRDYQRQVVISVPDGDSLDLADGRRIRLLGIDAPEKGRCMAQEARTKLVELALDRHVRLTDIVKDDFGRQLAMVRIGGQLVQERLVSAGLARNRSGSGNPYHRVLTDAQEIAKSKKLGIRSDACRGKTSGKDDCAIKANVRAGKKQYYTPDCATYEQVVVDTSFGDAWLCSESQALAAGFTRAASCN